MIATAYEDRMDGDAGRATWRTDQHFTQCNREEAGTYLRFLASIGYEMAPVEQAVADGVPYTGDQPADELADTDQHDGENPEMTAPDRQASDTSTPMTDSTDETAAPATDL